MKHRNWFQALKISTETTHICYSSYVVKTLKNKTSKKLECLLWKSIVRGEGWIGPLMHIKDVQVNI